MMNCRHPECVLVVLGGVVFAPLALANCIVTAATATCDSSNPNPYTATIGTGPSTVAGYSVTLNGGATPAQLVVGDANAISLGDGATITLGPNTIVRNSPITALGGFYPGATSGSGGPNTIEFRSNAFLTIGTGATVRAAGSATTAEAINAFGDGNRIVNHGTVQGGASSAIFFDNQTIAGGRNVVDNFGIIIAGSNNQAIGSSGNQGIVFTNESGARVQGNLQFSGGDDDLTLNTGSVLTGLLDGGGGINSLTLGGAGADSLPGAFRNFQSLIKSGSGTWTLTGSVSDSGSGGRLAVDIQQGTLALTGTNSGFNGSIAVEPTGTLQTQAQSLPPLITNNGAVLFDQATAGAYAGAIGGTGTVVKANAGTLTLTGPQTYTGGTTISAGMLKLGNGGATGSVLGGIVNNAALAFNRADALTFGGVVSGTGSLTQAGVGGLTLTSANTYTGTTHINNGVLSVASNSNLGAPAAPLEFSGVAPNGGLLQLTTSFNTDRTVTLTTVGTIDTMANNNTFTNTLVGPGRLIKQGSGTLTLTGNNTYAGTTTIGAGTLEVGAGASSGFIVGDVLNSAALVFNRSDALSYDGVVSGTGTLIQAGSGTLSLTGLNTYTGLTNVNAGVLAVNGAVAGNTQVNAGATLRGTGTVAGLVTVADAGHLAPGNSPGTFGTGLLVLNPNSQLDYELGLPGQVGGSLNDLTTVAGNLTLDGTLNLVNLGGMSPGVYRLFNYGGTLTNNGLTVGGALPTRFVSSDFLVETATPGQVNLIALSGGFALQFWDGANTSSNNAVDGGTATWNTTTTNWTSASGNVNAPWQSGFAVFQGTAGTVTLGENIAIEGMQFRTSGYTIEGGGFALAGEPETIIRVDPLTVATINAPIVDGANGPARLVRSDAGLLVLGGINTYSGGTAINGGAVQVSADANLGAAAGGLNLNNGTLITSASVDSARAVDLGGDGGTFIPAADTTLTLGGVISGPGMLNKLGTGTLVLAGANSYAGGTFLGNGVLAVASDANLGAAGGALIFGAGTLRLDADMNPAATRAVTLNALGGRIDTNGHNTTFGQTLSGIGGLTKLGSGTLVLAGHNLYEGGTTISAGTLQIGNGDFTGSVLGNITNSGALVFNRSGTLTYDGVVSGAGSVAQSGPGTVVLTADQSYTGGTAINAGTLQLGDGGSSGSVVGNIANNGALIINRSDTLVLDGTIIGSGSVTQAGPGTTTFLGTQNYSGTTTVAAGTLKAGTAGSFSAASAHVVDSGATLDTAGFNQDVAALRNSGTVSLLGPASGSTLTVTGAYVGDGGILRMGTVLGGSGSLSDRLVFVGPTASASGSTTIQITNLGGLGAQTTGNGIEVVSALNGATTTAQTTKDAFTLAGGGHVDAGAFEYRLFAADASGTGENWYLRSEASVTQPSTPPVVTFRTEVPLFAALPAQLRQGDLTMLGNLHRRVGDEDASAPERRPWARAVYTEVDVRQDGTVNPQSKGHLSGLQVGTDLWTSPTWHTGLYVGYLGGGTDVSGNARGTWARVGVNNLQSRYLGGYATWSDTQGRYVDAVLQGASHRYSVRPDLAASASGKASSLNASVEVGQSFPLAESWTIEPQAQLIYQKSDFDDVLIAGARVRQNTNAGWIARLGVRVKGEMPTAAGRLQPYGRFNLYYAGSGNDEARFVGPGGFTDVSSATGYSAAELAGGLTLALNSRTSLYGELGNVFAIDGNASVKSSVQGSLGVKVSW